MWKRSDEEAPPGADNRMPAPAAPPSAAPSAPAKPRTAAILGRSLVFQGKIAGEEDLVIEGRFSGEIAIPGHQVTVGAEGRVEADVRATTIVVEGEVRGNLTAAQQVLVRASGTVHGDIRAPRVALDQGCRFKGTIDMEPGRVQERKEDRREEPREEPRPVEEGGGRKDPQAVGPAAPEGSKKQLAAGGGRR